MDSTFFTQAPFLLASAAAIAAGLISFVSPCVLPLVPSFLGYITGTVVGPGMEVRRWHTFLHTVVFVLGFSVVFVVLLSFVGLLFNPLLEPANWLGGWPAAVLAWPDRPPVTYLELLQKVAGIFLVLFGLHTMGVLRIGLFDVEKRLNVQVSQRFGYFSSFLVGVTFALGWSPCVAAPLAGILFLGTSATAPIMMVWLLLLYSLGLGVPFLVVAFFLDRAVRFVQWMMRYRKAIAIVSGLLLIVIGLAVFFGRLQLLARLPAWF
jgi:cytochrome c-type biogenesis protein